jgi:hypothetical protein
LAGIWSFTWKTRLTWRRLAVQVALLLILPALVCLTTRPPRTWAGRSLLGDPNNDLGEFTRRLYRAHLEMKPDQWTQAQNIFTEEYLRTERELSGPKAAELNATRQTDLIRGCYTHIHTRLQDVLDENQFSRFRNFERQKVAEKLKPVGEPLWGRTAPFYHWLVDFYFFIILPLACVGASGALIREDLQANTLSFLTTRPMTRAKLRFGKYLALTVWLQIAAAVQVLLLVGAGTLRQIPDLGSLLPLLLGAQFLAVLAWGALGTFLGLVTKRYMAIALVYGFIVEMGIGRIPTNINTLSLMRHLKSLLSHNAALQAIYDWPARTAPVSLTALLLATVIFVTLAAVLFTVNEYHHNTEMQK